jgi:hypothetical protein
MTAKIVGTMASGKNDTGSMNSIRNACYIDYVKHLAQLSSPDFNMDYMVAGDDTVICLE